MLKIEENVRLAAYTTLQVGGLARYFAEPADEGEVVEALQWARGRAVAIFVLGGGSNLLVSDKGFDGLVLHMSTVHMSTPKTSAGESIGDVEVRDEGGKRIYSAGAGVGWDAVVKHAVEDNCAGLECLSGIPGSVGGTPVQNVGAYGQDVSETIIKVRAIDTVTLEQVEFDRKGCGFGYRQSRFNRPGPGHEPSRYILTRVDFALRVGGEPKIGYAELQRRFDGGSVLPTLAEVRAAVLAIRQAKGMVLDENDADSRSAGSFFKNPVVSVAEYERIAAPSAVSVPHFAAGDGNNQGQVKLAAAWLIEQAGIAKGFRLGAVAISSKHTLALTNRGGATAADVLLMKEFVQRRVYERFGVVLSPEPVMVGF